MWRRVSSQHQQLILYIADIYIVRTVRSRIIYLRNDYKDLMNVIEKAVHAHFAYQQAHPLPETATPTTATANGTGGEQAAQPSRTPALALEPPFAKVNSVVEGSPADQAGLKQEDLIRNFGYANRSNHDGLKKVAECVQVNEGVSLTCISFSIFHMLRCLHSFLPLGFKLRHPSRGSWEVIHLYFVEQADSWNSKAFW